MRWFEGSITAAITQAKQQRVLFVVYIYGDDDESKKMTSTWEDTAVTKVCEETKLIAMKFHSGSEECKQFSQFYPVLCVPSVSLIAGQTGVPLEGVAGYAAPEEFAAKIKKVNEGIHDKASSPVSDSVPVSKTNTATSQPAATASPPPQTEVEKKESLQERAARLRQKMEAVHQQKEAKKQEEQRQKEMDRRKTGQAVQKQRQRRAEEEARQVAEEMRKEKLEDKLAKERVREQIARDRAEKNARFAAERKEREQTKTPKEADKARSKPEEQKEKPKVNMDIARIQFRLPNGSAVTNQFPSSSTLQEAHDYLLEQVGDTLKQVTFSTTFPRRQFTSSDLSRTLLELELAPSAALVVLPGVYEASQPSRAVASSSGGSVFMWLFSPLLFIWNLLYSFLFGSSSSRPSEEERDPASTPPSQEQTQQRVSPESTGARPKSSYLRRRTPGGDGGSTYKRDGNIHRLVANSDEDDDDNNTWNGNSTQQM